MSALAAKVILGVVGVIAIPAVAWQLVYYLNGHKAIERKTLLIHKDYQIGDKKNTFGGKMAGYFLDTESDINKNLWNERFNSIKDKSNAPHTTGFFKDINNDNATIEQLKKVCSDKYQERFPTNDSEKEKWDEVWKYCAIPELIKKPKTVSESNEYSGNGNPQKIGQVLRNELISTTNTANERFWIIRYVSEFKTTQFLSSHDIRDKSKEKYKFFYDDSRKNKEIKDICQEAYEKPSNTSSSSKNSPTNDEVKKFCSIEMIRFFELEK